MLEILQKSMHKFMRTIFKNIQIINKKICNNKQHIFINVSLFVYPLYGHSKTNGQFSIEIVSFDSLRFEVV